MRILGPDGNPISTGSPVSPEVQQIVDRAKEIASKGDAATALQQMVYAFQSDVKSDLVIDTSCDLLRQMMQASGAEQSDELELFEQLKIKREDPLLNYQIGNRFFQLQQPFLARPFLSRAKELAGDDKTELGQHIDVDFSQVLMDLGAYQEAIDAFHKLNDDYGGLPIWLVLEMAECYALLRQMDEADAVYAVAPPESTEVVPGMDEVREEVGDLLARVRDFDEVEQLGLREWHYVQTRGMLLETNPDEKVPGERFLIFQPSEEDCAYLVGLTAAILDKKELAPNRILWLGPNSEPLARLFAQWWEVDAENIRPYQLGDNTDDTADLGLLVMSHSYDVFTIADEETFVDLAQARGGLVTFALDVRWSDRQPLTPDIAGFLSQACNLPWENRMQLSEDQQTVTRIEETRDAETVAKEISAQFIPDEEFDQYAQETLELYAACTDLILDHRDGTLIRRPLVTHSPIQSPRIGF